jgi:rhomboid protease GluP
MAIGFSPKYAQDLPLEGFTPQHFLVLAIEAAKQQGWNIGHTSENGFKAYTQFSVSSWSEEVTVTVAVAEGYASLKSECTGSQVADWGKNKRNIEDLIAAIDALKATVTTDELEQKYEDLKPGLAQVDEYVLSRQPGSTKEKITGVLAFFKPTRGYFVTPLIVDLNILIFALMVILGADFFSPDSKALIAWGANFRPITLDGEWWRLVTNCFLHIGILHLLFNMYALAYIGLLLEPYLGKLRFGAAYLLTGIVASTASLYWHDLTVSAGASGAIFGMYGVFLAMLTTNLIEKDVRKALLTSIAVFVVFNLMYGMKGGIDNAAHLGGLISGFVIGYLYYPGLKAPDRLDIKIGSIALLSIFTLFCCFMVYSKIPNKLADYDKKMREFTAMERMALEVYSMPQNTPKDSVLMEIKDRGIYYWNENIELINDADKMDLPAVIHERDKKLIYYCNLRIKAYKFMYKATDEGTPKYKDSIAACNKDIQALVDSLKGH